MPSPDFTSWIPFKDTESYSPSQSRAPSGFLIRNSSEFASFATKQDQTREVFEGLPAPAISRTHYPSMGSRQESKGLGMALAPPNAVQAQPLTSASQPNQRDDQILAPITAPQFNLDDGLVRRHVALCQEPLSNFGFAQLAPVTTPSSATSFTSQGSNLINLLERPVIRPQVTTTINALRPAHVPSDDAVDDFSFSQAKPESKLSPPAHAFSAHPSEADSKMKDSETRTKENEKKDQAAPEMTFLPGITDKHAPWIAERKRVYVEKVHGEQIQTQQQERGKKTELEAVKATPDAPSWARLQHLQDALKKVCEKNEAVRLAKLKETVVQAPVVHGKGCNAGTVAPTSGMPEDPPNERLGFEQFMCYRTGKRDLPGPQIDSVSEQMSPVVRNPAFQLESRSVNLGPSRLEEALESYTNQNLSAPKSTSCTDHLNTANKEAPPQEQEQQSRLSYPSAKPHSSSNAPTAKQANYCPNCQCRDCCTVKAQGNVTYIDAVKNSESKIDAQNAEKTYGFQQIPFGPKELTGQAYSPYMPAGYNMSNIVPDLDPYRAALLQQNGDKDGEDKGERILGHNILDHHHRHVELHPDAGFAGHHGTPSNSTASVTQLMARHKRKYLDPEKPEPHPAHPVQETREQNETEAESAARKKHMDELWEALAEQQRRMVAGMHLGDEDKIRLAERRKTAEAAADQTDSDGGDDGVDENEQVLAGSKLEQWVEIEDNSDLSSGWMRV